MEEIIIFGAGSRGRGIAKYWPAYFNIIGFFDSDKSLWGKEVEGKKVFSEEEVSEKIKKNVNIVFLISPINEKVVTDIKNVILTVFNGAGIADMDKMQAMYIEKKLNEHRSNMPVWRTSFQDNCRQWLNDISSEIAGAKRSVYSENGIYHEDFLRKMSNNAVIPAQGEQGENIYKYLRQDSVLMEIGTSQCARYGTVLPDGRTVKLIGIDGLAYFWNNLSRKYFFPECGKARQIIFGTFEFIAALYEKDYADVIIIENALDHGIDPLKGIIECLQILKPGGLLRMFHRRCEAVFEAHTGLHKWNIDSNEKMELIIWNDENYVNVNQYLGGDAKIKVMPVYGMKRVNQYITVEMQKNSEYDYRKYISLEEENRFLSEFNCILMEKFADSILK